MEDILGKTIENLALDLLAERLPTPYSFGYALAEELQKLTAEDGQKFLAVVLERFQLVPQKDALARTKRIIDRQAFGELMDEFESSTKAFCKAIFVARPRTEIFARMLLRFAIEGKTPEKSALIFTIVTTSGLLPYVQSLPKPAKGKVEDMAGMMNANFKEMASIIRLVRECEDMTLWQVADILLQLLPQKGVPRTALMAFFLSRFTDKMGEPPLVAVLQEDPQEDDEDNSESGPPPDKKNLN